MCSGQKGAADCQQAGQLPTTQAFPFEGCPPTKDNDLGRQSPGVATLLDAVAQKFSHLSSADQHSLRKVVRVITGTFASSFSHWTVGIGLEGQLQGASRKESRFTRWLRLDTTKHRTTHIHFCCTDYNAPHLSPLLTRVSSAELRRVVGLAENNDLSRTIYLDYESLCKPSLCLTTRRGPPQTSCVPRIFCRRLSTCIFVLDEAHVVLATWQLPLVLIPC